MKKLLMSIATICIALSMLGAGTFAYFSDEEASVGNTITAGTLTIEIKDDNEGWWENGPVHATWESPACWAPGQTFDAMIEIRNSGCMDINYISKDWNNPTGDLAFLDKILVWEWREYTTANGWQDYLQNGTLPTDQRYHMLVDDFLWPLTLRELMESYTHAYTPFLEPQGTDPGGWYVNEFGWWVAHLADSLTGSGYDIVPGPAIPVGHEYKIYMKFKFDPTAGNAYQGLSCGFDLSLLACQHISQVP